jgi:CO dehydrogenase/acetyl-CoA synthase beta subunit
MIEIHDPDNEIPEEQKARVAEMAEETLDVFYDTAETPVEMLQALAAVTSCVLSENMVSKESAITSLQILVNAIIFTLNDAEQDGNVNWNQKIKH